MSILMVREMYGKSKPACAALELAVLALVAAHRVQICQALSSKLGELSSMTEVTNAGKDHGQAQAICGGDHVLIFDGSAGLNDGGCASSSHGF